MLYNTVVFVEFGCVRSPFFLTHTTVSLQNDNCWYEGGDALGYRVYRPLGCTVRRMELTDGGHAGACQPPFP